MMTSLRRCLLFLAIAAFCIDLIPLFYHYHLTDHALHSPVAFYHPFLKPTVVLLIVSISYLSTPGLPPQIIAAAVLAGLGDLLLISTRFVVVLIGGSSFALSHVLFIQHFNVALTGLPPAAYALMLLLFVVMAFALSPSFAAFSMQTLSFSVYGLVLLSASCSAIARVARYGWFSPTFLLCAIGYALLVLSDAILLDDEIARGSGRRHHAVPVMITYIAGEFCVHMGVAAAVRLGRPRPHAD
jgi:uncharacterized membrane protein YhhN